MFRPVFVYLGTDSMEGKVSEGRRKADSEDEPNHDKKVESGMPKYRNMNLGGCVVGVEKRGWNWAVSGARDEIKVQMQDGYFT